MTDLREEISRLSLKRIALHGLWLNTAWEFVQCPLFYDMWDWGFWRGFLSTWSAIFGDVVIVLGVTVSAGLVIGFSNLQPLRWRGLMTLLAIGFIASISLEWIALAMERWSYTEWMPTVRVFGQAVGLLPVVQVTVLPSLSVYLATRSLAAGNT